MIAVLPRVVLCLSLLGTLACAGQVIPHEPDLIDVMLPVPADQVKAAVIDVLNDGGYDIDRQDDEHVVTDYRQDIRGPWDWMLHWRFGTGKSRVEARVTPASNESTRLRLHVLYEGKDGLFTRWEDSPTALPQSAENQLRLIKNALHLL